MAIKDSISQEEEHLLVSNKGAKRSLLCGWDGNSINEIYSTSEGNIRIEKGSSLRQMRIAYDSNNNPEYLGFAEQGEATSDNTWTIYKFTFDANGNPTLKQTATGSWDNRASLSYT